MVLALAVAAGAASCYTSPINMVPTISIVPPTPLYRHSEATFTARASDPDNDALEINWTHNSGACLSPPGDLKSRDTTTYVVPLRDTDDPFCVWAFVQDRYGATVSASYQADPRNHAPSAKIVVTGTKETYPPFSLYRPFQMEATMADDADEDVLEYVWSLRSDRGDMIDDSQLSDCPDHGREARCWTPQKGGMYIAKVTVTDGHDGTYEAETPPFRVAEDAAPCLGVTDPGAGMTHLLRRADDQEPVQISVLSVDDDGDPFPSANFSATGIAFTWFESTDMGPMVRKDLENRAYYLVSQTDPNNLGKTRRVRVEIADRNVIRSRNLLEGCGDEDVCVSAPGCFQRLTWTVTYGL